MPLIYFFLVVASNGALRAVSISFDFDFSDASTFRLTDFKTGGAAEFRGGHIELTPNAYKANLNNSVGLVSYAHPVKLREKATGVVASFVTAFSFVIQITEDDMDNKGDGMAFFLRSYPSVLPPNSQGGSLGLCTNDCSENKTAGQDRFVAVEFDTFNNIWDPSLTYDHMGIDVNSVKSVANVSLPSFSLNGQMSAQVEYNSSTGVMNAQLRFDRSPITIPAGATLIFNLSTKVDLGAALPEEVAIGFSAATGASIELHQLRSWSFSLISPGTGSSPSSSTGP